MKIEIAGTGHSVPEKAVSSLELDRQLGLAEGHLEAMTGVSQRFVCDGESQIDLARKAALQALHAAALSPLDVDLIISGCAVPYQTIPTTAPRLQKALGIPDGLAAAFDVNSTCLSFLTALEIGARLIGSGPYRNALIVSAEVASRALPWRDAPDVAALFGDGAAAAILQRGPENSTGRIAASRMRTFPSAYEACQIGAGGTRFDFQNEPEAFAAHARFAMDGKALYRITSQHFEDFVSELLDEARWRLSDVDVIIPHQASPHALAHLQRRLGISDGKVIDISRTYGNQIAASIPTALNIARSQGRLGRGMRALMLGTSAGVSFGGMALET